MRKKKGSREVFSCETCLATHATEKLQMFRAEKEKGNKGNKFKYSVCGERFDYRGVAMKHCQTEKKAKE